MHRGVAFDLDGTLVDSIADIGHALNVAFASESLPTFDVEQVRRWVGDGPDGTIRRALSHLAIEDADDRLRTRLRAGYDRAALAAPLDHGQLYPGIVEILASLQADLPLAVVTNKPTHLARTVLESAGILHFFRAVRGADRSELRKPEPVMLFAAARDLATPIEQLCMVGDSTADLGAAARAGCRAVFVEWGYGKAEWPAQTPASVPRATSTSALLKLLRQP